MTMITAIDKNTALVLIDLQKGILNMSLAHPSSDVLANAIKLVGAFRKEGLPIVFVNVNPIGAAWTRTRADQPGIPSDPAAQQQALEAMTAAGFFNLVPELGASSGDIYITQKTWSAFFETPLHEALQKRDITGIVLAGISTSIGVEGTARDASVRGYNIAFARDAMTDMHQGAHENSLQNIFPRIGEVDDTDAVIAHLARRK